MPHLIVTADTDAGDGPCTLAEELTPAVLADEHRRAQLLERVGSAVDDAAAAEEATPQRRRSSLPERLHRWFG